MEINTVVCGIQHVCVFSDVGLQVYKTLTQTPTYESSDWRKFGRRSCVNHWSMLLPDFLEIFLTCDSLDSVSQMVLRIGSLSAAQGRRGWVPGQNWNKSHEFALNEWSNSQIDVSQATMCQPLVDIVTRLPRNLSDRWLICWKDSTENIYKHFQAAWEMDKDGIKRKLYNLETLGKIP